MKKNILILGSTGMLGSAVKDFFLSNPNYETYYTHREENKKILISVPESKESYQNEIVFEEVGNVLKKIFEKRIYFSPMECGHLWIPELDRILRNLEENNVKIDYIINCIGIIKPNIDKNHKNSILINSILPHGLAEICNYKDIKLIHISTDCVYSGNKGKYVESDLHDALDFYGKSKSLGEPNNAMVLRTSIIGEEPVHKLSLIEWAKSQEGKEVNGFTNHFWNGITTTEYAKLVDQIIQNDLYENGIHHVYSDDVSKYEMLNHFNLKFNLNLKINAVEASSMVDRTLRTEKKLLSKLQVNSFGQMILNL